MGSKSEKDKKINVVDLFAGCGGLSLGFQNAGFNIVAAFDNWDEAISIYHNNFNHPIFKRDLNDVEDISDIEKFHPDIIIGGPPCQDYSSAGHRDEKLGRALYKIGSTSTTVTERIKNEPTYLYAGVDVIETYRCYNMGARELEDRLHTFSDKVRLNINIPDELGAIISPREWFCVNIDAISEAVKLIIAGRIDNYVYDPQSRSIIAKHSSLNTGCCVNGFQNSLDGINLTGATINIGTFHNHPGSTFTDNSVSGVLDSNAKIE